METIKRKNKPIKLAVVGGNRGSAFNRVLDMLSDKVVLTSVCDISEEVLNRWKEQFPEIKCFNSFDRLLDEDDCEAVFIATPMQLHAKQAIQTMKSGRHVLSEVPSAITMDECWELIETVEKTGLVYMLAENYCYMRSNMMVLNMVEKGVFGEITYAEGAYIHDCRFLMFDSNGNLTWRGFLHGKESAMNGNTYPTHSLGPVAQWLKIGQEDRLCRLSTFMSKVASLPRYVMRNFGWDHPGAKKDFWGHGDSATTVIETEKGVVIVLRFDVSSARPHNMTHYVLQGTTASYISPRYDKEDPLIWIEDRSPTAPNGIALEWESLWKYSEEFEHPKWKEWKEVAERTGHGGGDFFVLTDFINSILNNANPPIDVYDAVTWSSIIPLSIESVRKGGSPIDIPEFRRKK
jgi:predicted dehydrogenase